MTDALDDWEQAGEDDFQAPAVIIKPPKVPSAPTGGSKESGSTSLASVAERKGGQGLILFRKNHDQAMDRDKDVDFNAQVQQDSRSLHERNRDLWDKAYVWNSSERRFITLAFDFHEGKQASD
ncbi:hypothetical protein EDD11_005557 [Mortierella claussenii]|nr:hypothetical protein EDD11_005557 [Mortierella claussenii]